MLNIIPGQKPYLQLFHTNSDLTNINMIGNYSVASPGIFRLKAIDHDRVWVNHISIIMRDETITIGKFAGITGGLTNGILLKLKKGTETIVDLTNGIPIKLNSQLLGFSTFNTFVDATGMSQDVWMFAFNTTQAMGSPIVLDKSSDIHMEITCQDNMSSIIQFTAAARGIYPDIRYV